MNYFYFYGIIVFSLTDHLRMHLLRGEEVDEETVDVRSLPLQLTRLLQPILVPVPQSLRVNLQFYCILEKISNRTSVLVGRYGSNIRY